MKTKTIDTPFSVLLQTFFCDRLIDQRGASQQTVASYRDTFRLLLKFAQKRLKKKPTQFSFTDLDAPFVLAFLDHLEKERGVTARTRNTRLAAIRSFMRFASSHVPSCLPLIQRVLAIPSKRFDRPLLNFLSKEEMQAIIQAPNRSTWSGHRDHVLFATLYNTGARISEIIRLKIVDVSLGRSCWVQITGKGRKQRRMPLWKSTGKQLRQWIRRIGGDPSSFVFPNRFYAPMSRSGVENRLHLAALKAATICPSLLKRRLSPHVIRHTTAMHMLQSGVDITVIALWLGHESPTTTHHYVESDLAMKEKALNKLQEPASKVVRYRPPDQLLAFLENL